MVLEQLQMQLLFCKALMLDKILNKSKAGKGHIMNERTMHILLLKLLTALIASLWIVAGLVSPVSSAVADGPLFLSQNAPPLNLLVMGRDHKLYYEAYNDASDLDGDGVLDVSYKPATIDYYGYFNSFTCYEYNDNGTNTNLLDNDDSRLDDFFEPTSLSSDKTCTGTDEWSGDFLNYLTTSRIDALRKVLYGGKRSTDTTSSTILERSYIPQDAHSWGKEYTSEDEDGYNIEDYSPLSLPQPGTRHLFANTSLLKDDSGNIMSNPDPLFRVLNDSKYRVWEWLSIERPVAGNKCEDGGSGPNCETTGGSLYQIVPAEFFSGLTQTVYTLPTSAGHPTDDPGSYDTYVATYATAGNRQGSQGVANIDGNGNPFGTDDWYMTIFTGDFIAPVSGNYTFAIDGDDAIELIIDGMIVVGWYGGHGEANDFTHNGTIFLTAGTHPIEFRHEENTGSDSYELYLQGIVPTSQMKSYAVRVEVCKSGYLEANCQVYPNSGSPIRKPTGLLHEYGEDGSMKFGLLTGSYENNTQGGVLRKAVSAFTDEVDVNTGQYTNSVGIVKTIDSLKIVDFAGNYQYDCGWITTHAMNNGQCSDWGNPIAEMMYEGIRYFSGMGEASDEFEISASGNDDADLGLPIATWDDPYTSNATCAKPFELVISDINPSYDSDLLPGVDSDFGSGLSGSQHLDFNVANLGSTIWNHEFGSGDKSVFIGQVDDTYDGSPSPKTVSSFGNIRGLSPEEPTKQGSYYAASVSYYAHSTDLNAAAEDQKMNTFSVALASPLPQINIPVNRQTITLVPFAKSVAGSSISATEGDFQPTNTIVDFYIDTITPTSGRFRINFEDVEQGADHDMDAIAEYSYTVNTDDTVTVEVTSTYAAGGIAQHMGYVISGTTEDGTYLEVRDCDTANSSGSGTCVGNNPSTDPDYFLDTPPGVWASTVAVDPWDDNVPLPLTTSRTFTPDTIGSAATFLKDPLWYAAKYGFFDETVDGATVNGLPDTVEYDADTDGVPDNYFLVTNALTLSQKLNTAFQDILGVTTSAAAVATNSTRLDANTFVYQASFNTDSWAGKLIAYPLLGSGSIGTASWEAGALLDSMSSRNIFTYDPTPTTGGGRTFEWANLVTAQQTALNTDISSTNDSFGELRLDYLSGERCNEEQYQTGSATSTCYNGIFRDRTSILGDIINSDPWFVGSQNYGYTKLPGTEGSSYFTFRTSTDYLDRTGVLYVGANDGMLHAFDAGARDLSATPSLHGGDELFAFVPNGIYAKLSALTAPSYTHQYSVDGPVRATDAYLDLNGDSNYEWETILVGSLGAGGKGLYALRVTDPDNFSASDVLWEISPSTTGYGELGHVLDQAFIVRMANGAWAAVFGNGYGGASGHAVLYIADLATGALIKAIDVGGTFNGLSGAAPVDFNNGVTDSIVDTVYAGDLLGQLWKFDVSDGSTANWASAFGSIADPDPLFIAVGPTSSNVQPITVRPEIGIATATTALGDVMIYFGTGQYFETGDNIVVDPPNVESFYGILDNSTQVMATDLVEQEIIVESTVSGFEVRALSNNAIDYTTKQGWYIDLESPNEGAKGERVVERAQLASGKLIFVTLIPNIDVCQFGGDSWMMIVNPETGGNLGVSVYDLNNDNVYDSGDMVTDSGGDSVAVSGKKSTTGIISAPAVISGGDVLHLITSGTDMSGGDNGMGDEEISGAGDTAGRGSWRQIR